MISELMDQRKAVRPDELERRLKNPRTEVSDFESTAPSLSGYGRRTVWPGGLMELLMQQSNCSALENEISLNRVMVLKIDVLRQGRIIHFEFGCFGHVRR
jgi:hypothetical protein